MTPGSPRRPACWAATALRVFFEITLPLLLPAVAAAASLVFLFCFTSFGVILILGGPRFATLEVEIYRQAVSLFRAARGRGDRAGADRADLHRHGGLHARAAPGVAAAEPAPGSATRDPAGHAAPARAGRGSRPPGIAAVPGHAAGRAGRALACARRSVALLPRAVRQPHQLALLCRARRSPSATAWSSRSITTVLALSLGTLTAALMSGEGHARVLRSWSRSCCCRSARPR